MFKSSNITAILLQCFNALLCLSRTECLVSEKSGMSEVHAAAQHWGTTLQTVFCPQLAK